ncbi:hypothetical protein SEA_POKYPUPPY_76 [Gordonia phage PokyPuppy]|nr:hypothetical protein SEA_POKYPUPPY_76 [Gordonia phage PokyPuppy]
MAARVSHKYCSHPKTSHERAKCRSRQLAKIAESERSSHQSGRVQPDVGQNTTGDGMSVSQLANLLASSLDSLRLAEKRVEEHQRAAELAQEALTREMLDREPLPTSDGDSPVVAFHKRYSKDETKTYEFTAIGIPQEYVRQVDAFVNEYGSRIMWYVSAGKRPIPPMPWAELVKFMGIKGLETLQVLRSG